MKDMKMNDMNLIDMKMNDKKMNDIKLNDMYNSVHQSSFFPTKASTNSVGNWSVIFHEVFDLHEISCYFINIQIL